MGLWCFGHSRRVSLWRQGPCKEPSTGKLDVIDPCCHRHILAFGPAHAHYYFHVLRIVHYADRLT